MSDATWNPAGEARIRTDSSKDLEKDEREAREAAVELLPGADSEGVAYGEHVWLAAKAHFEARLQQVEAERDQKASVIADAERMYAKIRELLVPYKLPVESIIQPSAIIRRLIERITLVEAELSIAREALETATNDLYKAANQFKGMNPDGKNWEIFESKAVRAQTVLDRLQAKAQDDNEPIAEQMEKWDP